MKSIKWILIFLFLTTLFTHDISGQWTRIPFYPYEEQLRQTKDIIECNNMLFCFTEDIYGQENILFRSSKDPIKWEKILEGYNIHKLFSAAEALFFDTYPNELTQLSRSTDNGNSWIQIDVSFLYKDVIYSVVSDDIGMFMSTSNGIFYSQDKGINWTPRSEGLPKKFWDSTSYVGAHSIKTFNSKLYAGTESGIYFSDNNGLTWQAITSNGLPDFLYFRDIIFDNSTLIVALPSGAYKLIENSEFWERIGGDLEYEISSFSLFNNNVFAQTSEALYKLNKSENNWEVIYKTQESISDFIVFDGSIYLCDFLQGILMSSDMGNLWEQRNEGLFKTVPLYITDVDSYGSRISVKTSTGKLFLTVDKGKNWENFVINENTVNNFAASDTNFFRSFDYRYFRKSKNESWKRVYGPSAYDLIFADTSFYLVTSSWGLYQIGVNHPSAYQEGQGNRDDWRQILNEECITLTSKGNNLYVGTYDGLYLSQDFGKSWKQLAFADKYVYKVMSNKDFLICKTSHGTFIATEDNYDWKEINFKINLASYFAISDDNLIVVFNGFSTQEEIWKISLTEATNVNHNNKSLASFSISQNYPNPFNPTTKIKYSIPSSSFVTLKVYDLLGREVATLVNEEKPVGSNQVEFDGSSLTNGVYFYSIQAGNYSEVKKMILIK